MAIATPVPSMEYSKEQRIQEALLRVLRERGEMVPNEVLSQFAGTDMSEDELRVEIWHLISLGKLEFSDEQKLRLPRAAA